MIEINAETLAEAKQVAQEIVAADEAKESKKPSKPKVHPRKKLVAEKKAKGKLSKRKTAKLEKINKGERERMREKRKELKLKGLHLPQTKAPGPGQQKWVKKFRTERIIGKCLIKGCSSKTPLRLAKFCLAHKKQIRKDQLKENNKVWRARKKKGEVGHHVVYDGKPTKFAMQDKLAAKRIVSEGLSVVESVKDFEKILSKAPKAQA